MLFGLDLLEPFHGDFMELFVGEFMCCLFAKYWMKMDDFLPYWEIFLPIDRYFKKIIPKLVNIIHGI